MTDPFDAYLTQIQADLQGNKATEHTYRSAPEALLEALAPHIKASNEAKHIQGGAPDFVVERKSARNGSRIAGAARSAWTTSHTINASSSRSRKLSGS